MREIKFRAWDIEFKEMCFNCGLLSFDEATGTPDGFEGRRSSGGAAALESGEFELMQFTGLKDKNGEEIYEGDIVTLSYLCSMDNGESQWRDMLFTVSYADQSFLPFRLSECRVIGNIYENPELLERDNG